MYAYNKWASGESLYSMDPSGTTVATSIVALVARELVQYCSDEYVGIAAITVEELDQWAEGVGSLDTLRALELALIDAVDDVFSRQDYDEACEASFYALTALKAALEYGREGAYEPPDVYDNYGWYALVVRVHMLCPNDHALQEQVRGKFPCDPQRATYTRFRGVWVCADNLRRQSEYFQVQWDAACERGEVSL